MIVKEKVFCSAASVQYNQVDDKFSAVPLFNWPAIIQFRVMKIKKKNHTDIKWLTWGKGC